MLTAIFFILAAGIMNASFIIPGRFIKGLSADRIWFYYSLGFLIIPFLLLLILMPASMQNYFYLQVPYWLLLVVSGLIFGLGQVCFASALRKLGVALAFTANLGAGVTVGSLFVMLMHGNFFTRQGFFVCIAIALILGSLISYYYSNKTTSSDAALHVDHQKKEYHKGWLLAILTGIACGIQNIAFVIVAFHANSHLNLNNSYWVWPPFLFFTAIPMLIGFYWADKKQPQANKTLLENTSTTRNSIAIFFMGLFFTGSLLLYSMGMSLFTHAQQIIGWPAFMIAIIFTSQVWGIIYDELSNKTITQKILQLFSMLLLVLAILILAIKS